ncbi:hypothetical protein F7725_017505, partial [Dissostichus mawsoni]
MKSSVEPLQRAVEAHEATMRDLEQAATDHSTRIGNLVSSSRQLSKLPCRMERQHRFEDPTVATDFVNK